MPMKRHILAKRPGADRSGENACSLHGLTVATAITASDRWRMTRAAMRLYSFAKPYFQGQHTKARHNAVTMSAAVTAPDDLQMRSKPSLCFFAKAPAINIGKKVAASPREDMPTHIGGIIAWQASNTAHAAAVTAIPPHMLRQRDRSGVMAA